MNTWKRTLNQWFQSWSKTVEIALMPFQTYTIRTHQGLFSPLIFVVAVLWTLLTVGTAIGAFVTFFGSLLVLYFILTKVFGVEFEG
jgi:hypothetical protein